MRLRLATYGRPGGDPVAPGDLRPVVYLPTWLRWEEMKQRPQYLLEAFAAAGHEVWFVDPRLRRPETVSDRIHLVPSLRPVPRRGVLLYLHFAPLAPLVRRFAGGAVLYDLLDDLSIYEAGERGLAEEWRVGHHHPALVADADLIMASNPLLAERHRGERPDLLTVENGVDTARFRPEGVVAADLPPGPVIGFHGAIAPWIDLDLIQAVARLRPALQFVLVGPVDRVTAPVLASALRASNIHHLPAQPSDRIADYVRGFSVGILPFHLDRMTEVVTPLKMYEYLACGVPAVATPLPACVAHPAVLTGSGPVGFAEAVDRALAMGVEERAGLRAHAESADWMARLAPVLDRLDRERLRRVPV